MKKRGCNAQFIVMQAFGEDSVLIANELFVFLLDYNEENDYLWDFGDEGSSDDPFPSWQYETDGPYVLCLTVTMRRRIVRRPSARR